MKYIAIGYIFTLISGILIRRFGYSKNNRHFKDYLGVSIVGFVLWTIVFAMASVIYLAE